MLRKKALNRIYLTTLVLFIMISLFSLDLLSNQNNSNLSKVEYVSNLDTRHLYLLNQDNYLVKVDILVEKNNIVDTCYNILNNLSVLNTKYDKLHGLIPANTKINDITYSDSTLIVDFSKELLNINKNLEEKLIESIVYSLLEIENVSNVQIKIDGELLTKLNKNNINLPTFLNKDFGINKEYNINSLKDISKVVIYYISSINDNNYYVPVTKYINSKENKVKIIIDNLKGNYLSHTNLSSYLTYKTNIKNYQVDNDILTITFDNLNNDNLEEVTYSLASSIFDSMDITKVIFENESQIIDIKIKN